MNEGFWELYKGWIVNQKVADRVATEISGQLEVMRDDGEEGTPNCEDLEMIRGEVEAIKEFPYFLHLHTTAEDLYRNNVVANIEDVAWRHAFYE